MDEEEIQKIVAEANCSGCGTDLTTNEKGQIYCPTCYDPFAENTDPDEWTDEEIERRLNNND